MSDAATFQMDCNLCGGRVEFPAESEGATVPCPHCGKDLFLYRGVRAIGTPPANQPEIQNPTSAETIFCPKCGEKNRENNFKCVRCGFALHNAPSNRPAIAASSITYEVMADKVGLVPNVRKKDNVFQAVFTAAFAVVGTLIGLIWQGGVGALWGALAGIVVGGVISGVILCGVGLARK